MITPLSVPNARRGPLDFIKYVVAMCKAVEVPKVDIVVHDKDKLNVG